MNNLFPQTFQMFQCLFHIHCFLLKNFKKLDCPKIQFSCLKIREILDSRIGKMQSLYSAQISPVFRAMKIPPTSLNRSNHKARSKWGSLLLPVSLLRAWPQNTKFGGVYMCSSYIYKAGSIYKIKTHARIEDHMKVFDGCGFMLTCLSVAKLRGNFCQISTTEHVKKKLPHSPITDLSMVLDFSYFRPAIHHTGLTPKQQHEVLLWPRKTQEPAVNKCLITSLKKSFSAEAISQTGRENGTEHWEFEPTVIQKGLIELGLLLMLDWK